MSRRGILLYALTLVLVAAGVGPSAQAAPPELAPPAVAPPEVTEQTPPGPLAREAPSQKELAKALKRVRRRGRNGFLVPMWTLNTIVQNGGLLAGSAQIDDVVVDGQPAGVRVTKIKRGSVYARFGLRHGDIITEIDRRPALDSATARKTLLAAYTTLDHPRRINVVLTRRGKPLTLTYLVE